MGQKLGYLHVRFRQGVRGDLHKRSVEVFGGAQTVYGPVDSWEQKLAISLKRHAGPWELIWITSDRIGVNESPLARHYGLKPMEAIELHATGNVTIEGPYRERGTFTVRAHRADFDQQKSMLYLEGDGRRSAEMHLQQYPGAPATTTSYRKFQYNTEDRRFQDHRLWWRRVQSY